MKKEIMALLCLPILLLVIGGFYFKNFIIKSRQDKYGTNFNSQRKKLGVPIIKSTWHINERNIDAIHWIGKENVIGHKRKTSVFTGRVLNQEEDIYILKETNENKRLIQVTCIFLHNNTAVRKKIMYQIGNVSKEILPSKADSILKAENISRDY